METPNIEQVWKASIDHFKSDEKFQQDFRDFMIRCEPMLKVFEENKVYKMKFKEESSTIFFWVKGASSVLALLALLGAFIRWLLLKN